jgi:myo-inositol-1(or 4)-monophosphatase
MTKAVEPARPEDEGHEPGYLCSVAIEAARACGTYLHEAWQAPREEYEEKSPGDLVSEVDRTSQDLARSILLSRSPGARFFGEEEAATRSTKADGQEVLWIVDPLDGTANFVHRFPVFSVSIAAAAGSRLLAGAVFNPVSGELFSAAAGEGARLNGESIAVTGEADLSRAMLATGWPFRQKDLLESYLAVFQRVFWASQGIRRLGSAALDLCYLAAGRLEGFWEYGLGLWDIAAGALIVREAGGRVSDFGGGEGWWDSGDIVATNGAVHEALLAACGTPQGMRDLEGGAQLSASGSF